MTNIKRILQNNPIVHWLEKKLAYHNQSALQTGTAVRIFLELLIFGSVYSVYCFAMFHGLWYMNLLLLCTVGVFLYNYLDIRLEMLNRKFRADIPKTTRRLRYYLIHTKSINKALEKAEAKAPASTKKYLGRLKTAIESDNPRQSIADLKASVPMEWLKMIASLVLYCKEKGDKDNAVSRNLAKATNVIEFVNIEQGMDNAELMGIQILIFVLPLLAIPGIQLFNNVLFSAIEQPNLYLMQDADLLAAKILAVSNLSILFLSWIRKNS